VFAKVIAVDPPLQARNCRGPGCGMTPYLMLWVKLLLKNKEARARKDAISGWYATMASMLRRVTKADPILEKAEHSSDPNLYYTHMHVSFNL
jgi:hypothetical protein